MTGSRGTSLKLEHSSHRFRFKCKSKGYYIAGTLIVMTYKSIERGRERYLNINVHSYNHPGLSELVVRLEYYPMLLARLGITTDRLISPMVTIDTPKAPTMAAIDY